MTYKETLEELIKKHRERLLEMLKELHQTVGQCINMVGSDTRPDSLYYFLTLPNTRNIIQEASLLTGLAEAYDMFDEAERIENDDRRKKEGI